MGILDTLKGLLFKNPEEKIEALKKEITALTAERDEKKKAVLGRTKEAADARSSRKATTRLPDSLKKEAAALEAEVGKIEEKIAEKEAEIEKLKAK